MRILGRFTGPAYPFGPSADGTLGPKDDVSVVVASMANILTTAKFTTRYNTDIGSVIPDLLFDVNDEITLSLIRHFVAKDLGEQEPRIRVSGVYTEVPTDGNTVIVSISFSLVGDPTAQVYSAPVVFPREA